MLAPIWLTAAEMAKVLRVPRGTIYRWATEDNWRQTSNRRRPVYYDYRCAGESATRRNAGSHRMVALTCAED